MAELERSVIRERIVAGLAYARERGTKSGRPVGRPRRIFDRDQFGPSLRQSTKFRSLCSYFRDIPFANHDGQRGKPKRHPRRDGRNGQRRDGAAARWASATGWRSASVECLEPPWRTSSTRCRRLRRWMTLGSPSGIPWRTSSICRAALSLLEVWKLRTWCKWVKFSGGQLASSRSAVRRRKMSVRHALGGGPWRLARQTLAEGICYGAGRRDLRRRAASRWSIANPGSIDCACSSARTSSVAAISSGAWSAGWRWESECGPACGVWESTVCALLKHGSN